MKITSAVIAGLALSAASFATGRIVITEWMYSGADGEFIEITNVGTSAIDLTGWSYDDDSRLPGVFSLSGAGVVQAGQSVLLVEGLAADFRAAWNLDSSIVILDQVMNNLGRNDEINIFDSNNDLIDRLTYGDQAFPGTIRTQNTSGWTTPGFLGLNDATGWFFSSLGDLQGSYFSVNGDLANPGVYVIPTPGAAALMGLGALVATRRRR